MIRYHIVGVYQARTSIASDGSGQADITDGLIVDLVWKSFGVEAPRNAGGLELQVKTTWPVVEVVQFCTGSYKAVPGKSETVPEPFGVVSPVAFAMPLPDSDNLRISADKKSLITKKNGWTWTLTPTIVPRK